MKPKHLMISFISILFITLVGCGNDESALDPNLSREDRELNISSISTDNSSNEYPHTRPVKIQETKYDFRIIRGGDQRQQQQKGNGQGNQQPTEPPEQNQGQNHQQPQAGEQNNQQEQDQDVQQQAEAERSKTQNDQSVSDFEAAVVELTNDERSRVGLPALELDPQLSNVAREKSRDMRDNDYFSHTSPTYGSPFDMMRDFGVNYQSAGENIAQGQPSPEEVVNAWMNSQGHRENILSDNFTHIGVGHIENGHHWTQLFIQK
ncbi:CAP domain-containing protein [Oceanobacillus halotolerans]|uniref:CAP domain-containing protein n=1 Tax=Oceanobacillus halotolerans TaxID=2663380 RepID=UPI0013D7790D|nr:CAP domain-containing protein [Oceanobacillus halotolerans]